MGYSSLSLLHLVCPLEETMTFFLCGFKYFHGSLPDSPKQRLPQARTGKVRHIATRLTFAARLPREEKIMHVGYAPLFQNPGNALPDAEVYRQELRLAEMAEPLRRHAL
jgi:hypothetical protein